MSGQPQAFRFAVNVTPKPGILDPQGRAVEGRLDDLGIAGVSAVRVGRRVELTARGRRRRRGASDRRAPGRRVPGEPAHRGVRDRRPRGGGRMTRVGVVIFPGSNRDIDAVNALELAGAEPVRLWHEQASLDGAEAILVPGGFAYGDYLRAGVIARFSPIMRAVAAFAADGGLVLGICNGFQVLTEAHLLPGALLRNRGLRFVSREIRIAPERLDTPFTAAIGERRPVAHAGRPWRGLLLRRRR